MNTFYALMAEYETADIPLESLCQKYFGLDIKAAAARASKGNLPVPAYKAGTQKSPWLVSAQELAGYLDDLKEEAANDWMKRNNAA